MGVGLLNPQIKTAEIWILDPLKKWDFKRNSKF